MRPSKEDAPSQKKKGGPSAKKEDAPSQKKEDAPSAKKEDAPSQKNTFLLPSPQDQGSEAVSSLRVCFALRRVPRRVAGGLGVWSLGCLKDPIIPRFDWLRGREEPFVAVTVIVGAAFVVA
ncbi:MAG: hypothetical protein BJ554DRAFT_6647, partial [Olpidium bornovanus]